MTVGMMGGLTKGGQQRDDTWEGMTEGMTCGLSEGDNRGMMHGHP